MYQAIERHVVVHAFPPKQRPRDRIYDICDRPRENRPSSHLEMIVEIPVLKVVISMLNKNTPGAKKSEAKSEAPVSSYSYMRLKSVISG